MKLYHIVRTDKNPAHRHWDNTYQEAVVVAESKDAARNSHPSGQPWDGQPTEDWPTTPQEVEVTHLGEANPGMEPHVVCVDFYEA